MPIRNYTSKVSPAQTAGEIQAILAEHGAARIQVDYAGADIVALTFMMMIDGRSMSFRLEPDARAMLEAMKKDKGVPKGQCNEEQAMRTAWRNEKDWIDAQLAKVAAGTARLEQLMLGFAVTDSGQTVYERLVDGEGMKLLTD